MVLTVSREIQKRSVWTPSVFDDSLCAGELSDDQSVSQLRSGGPVRSSVYSTKLLDMLLVFPVLER